MGKIERIETIPISELKAYENNSKIHGKKQLELLQKSIKEFGFISPVLIDENNTIIAGHGRVEAGKQIGIETVPCVRVEGLTDEQRKAYVIADNRLSELGTWNKQLVANELSMISKFETNIVGFDIGTIKQALALPYGAERKRTVDEYNMSFDKIIAKTVDWWQMPIIENDGYIPKNLIGFNYAKTSKDKDVGIHFFIDDYQFERVWNEPEKYVDILSEYECILSPDFSLYTDMDMCTKIWNTYRSRKIGAYYQSCGINVIPTISWAERETYKFCFLGIPKGSIVAISTVGVKKDENAFNCFQDGVKEMIKQIKPSTILVYGGDVEFEHGDIPIVHYKNRVTETWKRGENDV